jgi:hypothetical protein
MQIFLDTSCSRVNYCTRKLLHLSYLRVRARARVYLEVCTTRRISFVLARANEGGFHKISAADIAAFCQFIRIYTSGTQIRLFLPAPCARLRNFHEGGGPRTRSRVTSLPRNAIGSDQILINNGLLVNETECNYK